MPKIQSPPPLMRLYTSWSSKLAREREREIAKEKKTIKPPHHGV